MRKLSANPVIRCCCISCYNKDW